MIEMHCLGPIEEYKYQSVKGFRSCSLRVLGQLNGLNWYTPDSEAQFAWEHKH